MKSDEVKVTVIMPVYNAAKYLERTLESLVNQTLHEIEIICVNDCSQDESYKILEEWSERDKRLVLISNIYNQGAAKSRNRGLEIARGKYLIFLDSDDSFRGNMLEEAYRVAERYATDLVVFGYQKHTLLINKNGDELDACTSCVRYSEQLVCAEEMNGDWLSKIDFAPWNKLVRADFIKEKAIRFQNLPTNNDIFFSLAVGMSASKIYFLEKILVDYYYCRSGSLTAMQCEKKDNYVKAMKKSYQYLLEHKVSISPEIFMNFLGDFFISYCDCRPEQIEVRERTIEELRNDQWFSERVRLMLQQGCLSRHNQLFLRRLYARKKVVGIDNISYYSEGLKNIIDETHNANKRIALWGCGMLGKKIITFLEERQIKIDYLIDSDSNKQGDVLGNYKIEAYERVKADIDVVVVAVARSFEEISEKIEGKEVIHYRNL